MFVEKMIIAHTENGKKVLTMPEYIEREALRDELLNISIDISNLYGCGVLEGLDRATKRLNEQPAADVTPARHGRWVLEAHDEKVNYRWNVTAECSECCDEKKEIWAGFFPNVPDWLARDVALESAKSVKLSNYCPNCGCRMDGDDDK